MGVDGNEKNELLKDSRDAAGNKIVQKRISLLVDQGTFQELDAFAKSGDHAAEAVTGFGYINGCPAYLFAQDGETDGGAMSKAQANKIRKIYELALKTGTPVVGIYDSIGGRLAEGGDMLAAYGEILRTSNNLSGVVPQISVVLGPCIGTSALIAAGADFVVMSEKAELTVETSGENSSAEEAEKLGICHILEKTEEDAIQKARELIAALPQNNLEGAPAADLLGDCSAEPLAESADAYTVISSIADDHTFLELSRNFGAAAVTGFARLRGLSAGIVALKDTIDADSCSKAARFVRFCDAFSLPVVTLVNAKGFASLREASKLSSTYSEATTVKVTVVTGESYGPVYIATAGRGANADITMAWASASVSPISPAAAAMFQWNDRLAGSTDPVGDRKKLIEEYKTTQASPLSAAADGYIEDVISPDETRDKVIRQLDMLSGKRVSTLPKKHSNIQL